MTPSRRSRELVPDQMRVAAAAGRIRALAAEIQSAQAPRAVVAGNIESWYPGPARRGPQLDVARRDTLERGLVGRGVRRSRRCIDEGRRATCRIRTTSSEFHCRGLVLGYVQSGKTTNFTAVIAKAADAGYRFFIVLSGVHDALRQQTQDRLNAQLWEPHPELWNRLTNEADFRADRNVDALLATQNQRVLAVVKKNGSRLRALEALA